MEQVFRGTWQHTNRHVDSLLLVSGEVLSSRGKQGTKADGTVLRVLLERSPGGNEERRFSGLSVPVVDGERVNRNLLVLATIVVSHVLFVEPGVGRGHPLCFAVILDLGLLESGLRGLVPRRGRLVVLDLAPRDPGQLDGLSPFVLPRVQDDETRAAVVVADRGGDADDPVFVLCGTFKAECHKVIPLWFQRQRVPALVQVSLSYDFAAGGYVFDTANVVTTEVVVGNDLFA